MSSRSVSELGDETGRELDLSMGPGVDGSPEVGLIRFS